MVGEHRRGPHQPGEDDGGRGSAGRGDSRTLAASGLDAFPFAELQMGRVLASRGQLTEAMTMIGRALDHIKEMGQSISAIDATVELASSLVSAGQLEEAIDKLGAAGARSTAAEAYGRGSTGCGPGRCLPWAVMTRLNWSCSGVLR